MPKKLESGQTRASLTFKRHGRRYTVKIVGVTEDMLTTLMPSLRAPVWVQTVELDGQSIVVGYDNDMAGKADVTYHVRTCLKTCSSAKAVEEQQVAEVVAA